MSWRAAPWIVVCASAAAFTALHASFTIDDAAISFAYARSFAFGDGLGVLGPGLPRVEGYSNVLWVVLLAGAAKAGLDLILSSKILGVGFTIGTVTLVLSACRRLTDRTWLLWAGMLTGASLTFALWSASGLENAQYSFLVLLALTLSSAETRRARIALGVVFALVAITRPEGFIYAGAFAASRVLDALLARNRDDRVRALASIAQPLVVFAVMFGAYLTWHWSFFGYLFPNTVYAKTSEHPVAESLFAWHGTGWTYVRQFFVESRFQFVLPALLVGTAATISRRRSAPAAFAAASLLLPLAHPDWMMHFRFLHLFVPLATILVVGGLDALFSWTPPRAELRTRTGALAPWAMALGMTFATGAAVFQNVRMQWKQHQRGYGGNVTLDEIATAYAWRDGWMDRLGVRTPLYLFPDIGGPVFVNHQRVIDLAGLADVHVAHSGWDRKLLERYFFEEQRPDLVHTHGAWTQASGVSSMAAIDRDYLVFETHTDDMGRHGDWVRRDLIVARDDPARSPPAANCGASLMLSHADMGGVGAPGGLLRGDAYWYVNASAPGPRVQRVRILSAEGGVVSESVEELGYGLFPASRWPPGTVVRQHLRVRLPARTGSYSVEVDSPSGDLHCDVPVRAALEVRETLAPKQLERTHVQALELVRTGKPRRGIELIDRLADAVGELPGIAAVRADVLDVASVESLSNARAQYARGDFAGLAETAAALRFVVPKLADAQAWGSFARELRIARDQAEAARKAQSAYELALAITRVDPSSALDEKALERLRRAALEDSSQKKPVLQARDLSE